MPADELICDGTKCGTGSIVLTSQRDGGKPTVVGGATIRLISCDDRRVAILDVILLVVKRCGEVRKVDKGLLTDQPPPFKSGTSKKAALARHSSTA